MTDIMKMFPKHLGTPYKEQERLIRDSFESLMTEPEVPVFIEGPPGTGKSACAMTLARFFRDELEKNTAITTVTIALQEQYKSEYSDVTLLQGKTNFSCGLKKFGESSKVITCQEGFYMKSPGKPARRHCEDCPYVRAREEALASPILLANYASLHYMKLADKLAQRDLLILDEGHNLEKFLMDFWGLSVSIKQLQLNFEFPGLVRGETIDDVTIERASEVLRELKKEVDSAFLRAEDRDKDKYDKMSKKIVRLLQHVDEEGWVVTDYAKDKLVIKPITIEQFTPWSLNMGRSQIIMSATLMDKTGALSSSLGIKNRHYVTSDSTFKSEHRKIYTNYSWDMSERGRKLGNWLPAAEAVSDICRARSDVKGVVICPSFSMIKFFKENLEDTDGRFLFADGFDRKQVFNSHIFSDRPTVLFTASHWEGVDLKDDKSRFQIIPKVPYMVPDPQVRARSWGWQNWNAILRVIQAYGRSVRSVDDWAETWILDKRIFNTNLMNLIPDWVQDAFSEGGDCSE